MKFLLFTYCLFYCYNNGFAQSLEGEWTGSFTYYKQMPGAPDGINALFDETPFRLFFKLNPDSSYAVTSYTPWPNPYSKDSIVNKVLYKKLTNDSIYLQELITIKPGNVENGCLQVMRLKFKNRKRFNILEGTWTTRGTCTLTGEMILSKKNN